MLIMPHKTFFFPISLSLLWMASALSSMANVKETHKLIEEWVQTELLISKETSLWKSEKASLLDLEDALSREILELDESLAAFETEESNLQDEREKLAERKNAAEESTRTLREAQRLEAEIRNDFQMLPAPLRERLSPFREKRNKGRITKCPRKRLELTVSLLQAIHIFNRTVTSKDSSSLWTTTSRENSAIVFRFGRSTSSTVATVAGRTTGQDG